MLGGGHLLLEGGMGGVRVEKVEVEELMALVGGFLVVVEFQELRKSHCSKALVLREVQVEGLHLDLRYYPLIEASQV